MNDDTADLRFALGAEPGCTLLRLTGDVDFRSSPALREELLRLIDRGARRLILDLSDVEYVDSSGVGTLVEARRHLLREGGELFLASMRARVRGVFEIARLDRFFKITDSVDEARNA
jgi:anti-sigma B factor antagonist